MTGSQRVLRVGVGVALVTAAVAALLVRDWLDTMTLEATFDDLGAWAPAAFIAAFGVGMVAFVPGSLFGLAGGALFGPLWGGISNLIGGTLGATLAFLAARYLAGDWAKNRTGGKLQGLIPICS